MRTSLRGILASALLTRFAVGWVAMVLSVGAVTLLFVLLRRGEAVRGSALFHLVPPCTAWFAWLQFDEVLGPLAAIGLALSVAGVALAARTEARSS